jgi:hypothetical protein
MLGVANTSMRGSSFGRLRIDRCCGRLLRASARYDGRTDVAHSGIVAQAPALAQVPEDEHGEAEGRRSRGGRSTL